MSKHHPSTTQRSLSSLRILNILKKTNLTERLGFGASTHLHPPMFTVEPSVRSLRSATRPAKRWSALLSVAPTPIKRRRGSLRIPAELEKDRRGWDSNTGAILWTAARFPVVLLRPLGHLSKSEGVDHPSGTGSVTVWQNPRSKIYTEPIRTVGGQLIALAKFETERERFELSRALRP